MPVATLKKPAATPSDAALLAGYIASAVEAIGEGRTKVKPFRHWLFSNILPTALCHEILALPIPPAPIADTYGKRDSHNDLRRFFSPESRERYPVMRAVADIFQSMPVARAIEKSCGAQLAGSFLRIEYCQDRDGFWLEPHMDIREKHITLQIYLNTGQGADSLGTDIYDSDKKLFGSAPSTLGEAMMFVPKEPESWHGFEKRAIPDVRRSLIVNYVTDDWRSRHELSFPDQKVS